MNAPQTAPLPVRRIDPWFRPSRQRHVVIADDLRAFIESGQIGGKLPDVPALCEQYGCTVKTALRALRVLELEQVIYLILGQGFFITADDPPRISRT